MIKDKNLLAYSFPQKETIFDLNYDYAVVRKISDFWWQDDSLYLEVTLSNLQKSTLKITLYSNGIINLQYYQKKINNSRFAEHLNSLNLKKIDLINHPNYFEIELLKNEKLVIQKEPFQITLLDCNAVVKFKTNTRKGYEMFENYRTPPLGWKIGKSNEWQPFMSFWLMNDEKIYGLGEKFRFLVKNGIETTIWNSDNSCVSNHDLAYNGLPLFYSTKKWGVLVNTGERTSFEIGSPVTDAISFLSFESCLDLYFFTGSTMKELISQYTNLTGKPTEIPDLSYGIWCNRLYYHNKAELWAEIEKSNKVNFPLDVICLDPKWLENRYTKSCNFEYNENAFGSFQELFAQLKAKNIAVCFWINPYLQADNSVNWQIALKNNYLVKTTNDNSYAHPLTGTETYQTNCGIVDFTNPAAVKWYQDELQKLFKLGLRFVKPDYGDGIPPNAYFNNGLTGEEFRQYYHFLYCKTAYDASVKYFGPNKTLSFCRPGYIGTQRFSGKWSGDSYSNFTELKIHLNAGLSLGMSGEMAWGTDIGGFYSEEPFDEDLYMRWTQVGMLCPLSRFHGIGPREPWNFSARVLDNAIKYAKLKRKLLPYFKMCELEVATTGVPILRAMVLENEDDSIAQSIDNQFYLGSNLLVAPVLTPQTTKREVYLPAGEWFLFGQKEKKYLGKQSYLLVCPVDEMLIFVKGNTIIPTIKEDNYRFEQLDTVSLELNLYGTLPAQYDLKFKLNEKLIIITYQNKKFDVSSNHNYLVK